ncbi:hypothetical protein KAH81_01945 [bacterium]|nr:hypothetical protein [bacterium]
MRKYLAMLILLVLPLALIAQYGQVKKPYPDIGLKTAGLKVGPAIPDSPYKIGFAFAVTGDFGKLHEIVGLEVNVEYFRVTKTVQQIYTNSHSDMSISATVKLMPKVTSLPFEPYLGGGLGFHYLTDTPDETLRAYDPIEHDARPEIHLVVGGVFDITEEMKGVACFKVNLSDISTYNPYIGVFFEL